MSARLAALSLGLALIACAPAGSGPLPAGTAAPAGPRVILPSSAVVRVELAVTDAERTQGLMFRESLAADAGMLFLFDGAELRPFWMRNCHFPLDIVHLTKDGTVVDVLANVPPCTADPCPTYPPAASSDTVLELNAGVAAKSGLLRGVKIRFVDVPER
jgi:uncharacterized membrane protein (UPF0127 family)